MDSYSWKRNLFPTYYRSISLKDTRGSQHATRIASDNLMPTKTTSASVVISEQTPEDDEGNGTYIFHLVIYLKKHISIKNFKRTTGCPPST